MTGWYIVLGILAFLVLLGLLPVGARAVYDGEEPRVWLTLWLIRIQLLPKKKKILTEKQREKAEAKAEKKKQAKEEKKKKKAAEELTKPRETKTLKEKIDGIIPFVKLAIRVLGTLRRKLLIRQLTIHMQLGGGNAAKTAQTCGYAWAAAGAARNLLAQSFRIRHSDIQVNPDFAGGKTEIHAELDLRFLLFDLLALAVKYGFQALGILIRQQKPVGKHPVQSEEMKKAVQS